MAKGFGDRETQTQYQYQSHGGGGGPPPNNGHLLKADFAVNR